jgi:hypothetical protein
MVHYGTLGYTVIVVASIDRSPLLAEHFLERGDLPLTFGRHS